MLAHKLVWPLRNLRKIRVVIFFIQQNLIDGQRIEHMKLMIDKLRQMMFGKKSEKVILKLEHPISRNSSMEMTAIRLFER